MKGIGGHAGQARRPWDPHEGDREGRKGGHSRVLDVCAGFWGPQSTPPGRAAFLSYSQGLQGAPSRTLTQAGSGWAQQELQGPPLWQTPILEV